MIVITSLEEAKREIESYDGRPEEFALAISDQLQDPIGFNMAIICDMVLTRGWEPDGFEQEQGFRIYRYKAQESLL